MVNAHSKTELFGLSIFFQHTPQGPAMPLHNHGEFELNYVIQGAITYAFGSQAVQIKAGHYGLFWAAIPHKIIHTESDSLMHIATLPLGQVLNWDLPPVLIQSLLAGAFPQVVLPRSSADVAAQFEQWKADLHEGTVHVLLLEVQALLHRFAQAVEAPRTSHTSPPLTPALSKAQHMAAYISRHYDQAITVADVATCVQLHPNYAMKVFKTIYTMSIVDYLQHYRIAQTQGLLLTTDVPIVDVALACGFQTMSHFYATFKRFSGMSPGQYRKLGLRVRDSA